jgi:hypothetical protein
MEAFEAAYAEAMRAVSSPAPRRLSRCQVQAAQ